MKALAFAASIPQAKTARWPCYLQFRVLRCGMQAASYIYGAGESFVFLNRLESGLLLLRTPQGYMAMQPSFWQRAYLIWTFRNFRELSPPLLNPRQLALVKTLANQNASFARSYDPSRVIGVVDFSTSGTKIQAPKSTPNNPERVRPELVKPELFKPELPKPELSKPELLKEDRPRREAVTERAAISANPSSERRYRFAAAQSERPKSSKSVSKIPPLKIAAAATLLGIGLIVGLIVVVHRIGNGIASLAHNLPAQSNDLVTPPAIPKAAEAPVVANVAPSTPAAAVTPSSATSHRLAGPEAVVDLSAIRAAASISSPSPAKPRLPLHQEERRGKPTLSIQGVPILATRPPLRFKYPEYSDIGARGEVALMAEVNSDGTVRSVRVVSGNRALAAVAVRAVRGWRYPPYLKNGEPIATETNIVVSFFSEDAVSMSFPPTISARR